MTPVRIQMTRKAPWRDKHPNAVIVDRRSKWGNPFRVGDFSDQFGCKVTQENAVKFFEIRMEMIKSFTPDDYTSLLEPLRGKDLACWCSLENACHADVLLRLANEVRA